MRLFILSILLLWSPLAAMATKLPAEATKFVIVRPDEGVITMPITITVQAKAHNNKVDTAYQGDVTLAVSGFVTGGGLINIVNGVGTTTINDLVAETVVLSLSDTEGTGLDVSSTREVTFIFADGAGALDQTNFWFRDDDGTEITASGYGDSSVGVNANLTDVAQEAVIRLRFGVKATTDNSLLSGRLEFKRGIGCDSGDWTTVASTSDIFYLRDSLNFHDGDLTTKQITSGSFVAGDILSSNNPAPTLYLPRNKSTEFEWSLTAIKNIPYKETLSFRVTKNGAPFAGYSQCPSLTFQPPAQSLDIGSAGGARATSVRFSGLAYPGSKVEVLRRSQVDEIYHNVPEAIYTVSDDGKFNTIFIALLGGEYLFALRAEDKDGRKTGIMPFTVNLLEKDELVAENLFVSPTVGLPRRVIRSGDFLTILGYAAPFSLVEFEINGWPVAKTAEADNNGFYKALIPTEGLAFGNHALRLRQRDKDGRLSDFSTHNTFVISRLFTPKADFNNDGKLNISDWSVFLSGWGAREKKTDSRLDLNNDGKIDISDFSVLMQIIKR